LLFFTSGVVMMKRYQVTAALFSCAFACAAAVAADLNGQLRERTDRALQQPPMKGMVPEGDIGEEQRKRTQEALRQTPGRYGLPDVRVQRSQRVDINEVLRTAPKVERDTATGPIVFVSLSMPMGSLVRLAADAQKVGGVLVMRGTVNGSLKQTVEAVQRLSEKGVEVQIDPQAFTRYQVTAVPAMVVDLSGPQGCEATKACANRSPLVEGDVSLKYSLEYIARTSRPGRLKTEADRWIAMLGGVQ
jgi:conjugal transfer pilus assembly protein TrbC